MANLIRENCAALNNYAETEELEIKLVKFENETPAESFIPIVDGNSRAQAFRIADKVQDEAHKFWLFRRKRVIKSCIYEINKRNAYSFAGYMITTSRTQSVLGDIEKFLTYDTLKHLMLRFLKQAEDCNLKESFQYRKLKKEYNSILGACGSSPNRKVCRRLVREINMYIENLYLEMNKVLH